LNSGELVCTISIAAPVGSVGLKVSTFAQTGGQGDAISIGETTVGIAAGSSVDAEVTLLGVVSQVSLVFSPASLPIATAGTFTATISAKDINGDVITGNDNYYRPLIVSTSDVGGHVTAAPLLPLRRSMAVCALIHPSIGKHSLLLLKATTQRTIAVLLHQKPSRQRKQNFEP
jgi:hypothetical protein